MFPPTHTLTPDELQGFQYWQFKIEQNTQVKIATAYSLFVPRHAVSFTLKKNKIYDLLGNPQENDPMSWR